MDARTPATAIRKRSRRIVIDWTEEKKAMFFDHLSVAGNISAAARAIGVSPTAVHHLRSRDVDFAAAWDQAIEAGYATIEMRLIGHVLAGSGRGDDLVPVEDDGPPIDVDLALRLLKERDTRRTGGRMRGAAGPRRATAAETDAAILAKLAAIAARRAAA